MPKVELPSGPVVHIGLKSNPAASFCGEPIATGWIRDRPLPSGELPICPTCRMLAMIEFGIVDAEG